jgi:hypothetical protein
VAPDVVLLDAKMRDYFNSPEIDVDRDRFLRWLGAHDGRLIASIDDPTYGLMEVYAVRRS